MTRRRGFLKTAGAALLVRPGRAEAAERGSKALRNARALVADGRLGRVWLCRIPDRTLTADVAFVVGSQLPIFDLDASTEGIVLLGSKATLAIGRAGVRLFSSLAT